MAELTEDEVQSILAQWPVESKELPPPVRDVHDAWHAFRWAEIKSAVEAMSESADCAFELVEDEELTRAVIARGSRCASALPCKQHLEHVYFYNPRLKKAVEILNVK